MKKDCRVEYVNKYSFLVDYSNGEDRVIYYSSGCVTLNQLYSDFKYRVSQEMAIDNFTLSFMPAPFKRIDGAKYIYNSGQFTV